MAGMAHVQPEPHPDPGWERDCGVSTPLGGVVNTFWNTPPTGFDTTTNAGELLILPVAQVGRQLFTYRLPLPDPSLLPQDDQVMSVMETPPLAQPRYRIVGRTCGFDPALHDRTVGTGSAPAVVGTPAGTTTGPGVGVGDPCVVAAAVTTALARGGRELMASPMT